MQTKHTTSESRFLSAAEICAVIGISPPTLYRWVKNGTFPAQVKVGPWLSRWDESEVSAWIESQRQKTSAVSS